MYVGFLEERFDLFFQGFRLYTLPLA
jgi:hypothetical protein